MRYENELFVIIENVKRFILQGSRMGACGLTMFGIVPVVTSLAECSKIIRITILGCVVEMSNREDYPYPLLLAVNHTYTMVMILNSTELTAIICPLQYLIAYILPVGRISFLVFWSYWHRLFECGNQRVPELPLVLDKFNSSFQIGEFI